MKSALSSSPPTNFYRTAEIWYLFVFTLASLFIVIVSRNGKHQDNNLPISDFVDHSIFLIQPPRPNFFARIVSQDLGFSSTLAGSVFHLKEETSCFGNYGLHPRSLQILILPVSTFSEEDLVTHCSSKISLRRSSEYSMVSPRWYSSSASRTSLSNLSSVSSQGMIR